MGLLPDGDLEPADGEEEPLQNLTIVDEDWVSVEWTLGKAIKTARFWLIFAAFSLVHVGWYIIMVHQVAHIIDVGYSKMLAAFVVGWAGLPMVAGGIFFGHLSDRFGREAIWTVGSAGFFLGALTFMVLKYPGEGWML